MSIRLVIVSLCSCSFTLAASGFAQDSNEAQPSVQGRTFRELFLQRVTNDPRFTVRDGIIFLNPREEMISIGAEPPEDVDFGNAGGGPPMMTDDPGTVARGDWEINVAFTSSFEGGGADLETPLLDINYGLSNRAHLKVEIPFIALMAPGASTQSGVGNLSIGLKYRFLEDGKLGLALSIFPQVGLNTNNASVEKGLVEKGVEIILPVQVQKKIGDFTVGGDLGYRAVQVGAPGVFYGVLGVYSVNDRLQVMAEVHGESDLDLSERQYILNLGGRFQLNETFSLLVSAGKNIYGGNGEFVTYVGLQTRIGH